MQKFSFLFGSILLVLFTYSFSFAHWSDDVIADYYSSGIIPSSIVYNNPNSFISKGDASSIINLFYSFEKEFQSPFHSFELATSHGYFENSEIDDYILREEIAPIVCKLSSYDIDDVRDIFFEDDDHISKWAQPFVHKLCKEGVLFGYPDNTFKPDKYLSFGELVTILSRIKGTGGGNLEILDDEIEEIDLKVLGYSDGSILLQDIDSKIELKSGEAIELAIVIPTNYDEDSINISVKDEHIATFDRKSNLLTGIKAGKTIINISYKENVVLEYQIVVEDTIKSE